MKRHHTLLTLTIVFVACGPFIHGQSDPVKSENHLDLTLSRIAFGACNNPRNSTDGMYQALLGERPDVFVFLGDNIYGDTKDMNVLQKKYDELREQKGFKELQEKCTMLATWDDHDYGDNDGGNDYPMRKESEKIFLDFFKEPEGSIRRQRPGIYSSHTFGQQGQVCQIILLDTRYFRDKLPRTQYKKGERPDNIVGWYRPTDDTSMTLLGDAQWKWLEQQLQVPADFRIIASSIQMLAVEKGMENWGHVPHEQQRLFRLLKQFKAHQTIVISGDVHFAELSKVDIGGYPLYDFTSSGMTHAHPGWAKTKNSFRIGKAYAQLNAGVIDLNWKDQYVELRVIDHKGKSVISHKIPFSELQFK
ncbi:MAG: alkaline phosphatase family protein [Verrucomicrobiae bacterium]|nr:alkaline phosphatase family protein [Verrucomicrobiae bacterium]NNJ43640.1 alkaline phosphatase family protein [Akkermansiaceae bacterium]